MLIAIDGPSGSGKSTLAKRLAARFHLRYIDTGAMYRTVTVLALKKKLDPENEAAIVKALNGAKISFKNVKGRSSTRPEDTKLSHRVYLNGVNVSRQIRTNEISSAVSYVARHARVREIMVALQRKKAGANAVLEGRDITTVVLPHADVKIFLEADEAARIDRRKRDYKALGQAASRVALDKEIARRDKLDRSRKVSPLKLSEDAIHIDTTKMNADEVYGLVETLVLKAAKQKGKIKGRAT